LRPALSERKATQNGGKSGEEATAMAAENGGKSGGNSTTINTEVARRIPLSDAL